MWVQCCYPVRLETDKNRIPVWAPVRMLKEMPREEKTTLRVCSLSWGREASGPGLHPSTHPYMTSLSMCAWGPGPWETPPYRVETGFPHSPAASSCFSLLSLHPASRWTWCSPAVPTVVACPPPSLLDSTSIPIHHRCTFIVLVFPWN